MSEAINERDNNAASVSGWESLLARPPIMQKAPEHKVAEGDDSATGVVQPSTAPQKNDGDYSSWMRPSFGQTSNHAIFAPERDENRAPISAGHAEKDNRSIWAGMHRPMPQKPESAAKAPEKIPLEPQINQSAVASAEDINQLLEYPRFGEFAFEGLSKETREKLDVEFASIEEDERKDYANPYKLERRHTRDEYDRFRQEVTDSAIRQELSGLDATTLSKLKEELEEIDYDEKRGWRGHTKEDFDHFRQEAIVNALRETEHQAGKQEIPAEPNAEPPAIEESEPLPWLRPTPAEPKRLSKAPKNKGTETKGAGVETGTKAKPEPETNTNAKETETSAAETETKAEAEAKTETNAETDEAKKAAEMAAIKAELDEIDKELARNSDEMLKYEPLSAVRVEYNPIGREDLARDLAKIDLERKIAESSFIKRLWMGKKFRRRFIGMRSEEWLRASMMHDGVDYGIKTIAENYGQATKNLASRMAHQNIRPGEYSPSGTESEATKATINAIGEYAIAMRDETDTKENLKHRLSEELQRIAGASVPVTEHNYLDVADQVADLVKHDVSLDRALAKINFYNFRLANERKKDGHYDMGSIFGRIDAWGVDEEEAA